MKPGYKNTCKYCGREFTVNQKCKSDPSNKRKFVRSCSKECSSKLKSENMKNSHKKGILKKDEGQIRVMLDRDVIVKKYCYEHKLLADIAKELGVKGTTLSREMERLRVPKEFIRTCPRCKNEFSCGMRSMTNPESNKFKKYCSRKCFHSSRRSSGTWIEVEVREYLKAAGFSFKEQHEIGRFSLDFYIPEINTAVEVNGDFWHANPDIYGVTKPIHRYHDSFIEKDKRKNAKLKEKGIHLIVIWENDLKNNLNETLIDLAIELRERFYSMEVL